MTKEQATELLRYIIAIDQKEEAINEPIAEMPKAVYTVDRIKLGDTVRIINTEIYGTAIKVRHDSDMLDEAMVTVEHVAEIHGKLRLVREELLELDLIKVELIG